MDGWTSVWTDIYQQATEVELLAGGLMDCVMDKQTVRRTENSQLAKDDAYLLLVNRLTLHQELHCQGQTL